MRQFPALDRDLINNAGTAAVGQGIVHIMDAAQKLPKEVRVLAIAGTLALMFERFQIPPQDVMTVLGNLRAEAEQHGRVEFKAIEQYMREDIGER